MSAADRFAGLQKDERGIQNLPNHLSRESFVVKGLNWIGDTEVNSLKVWLCVEMFGVWTLSWNARGLGNGDIISVVL